MSAASTTRWPWYPAVADDANHDCLVVGGVDRDGSRTDGQQSLFSRDIFINLIKSIIAPPGFFDHCRRHRWGRAH